MAKNTSDTEEQDSSDHLRQNYGRKAARRSLRHFLVGKGFMIVSSLATVILLARYLSTTDYAVYISFRALTEIARVATAIGITAVLYRYLPELWAQGNNRASYRLLMLGWGIRIAALVLIFGIALQFAPQLGVVFNLGDWLWLLPWALFVAALNFAVHTLSQSMESFLWQKEVQISLALGNLTYFAVVVVYGVLGELSLPMALAAEGAGYALSVVLLLIALYGRWRRDPHRKTGDTSWLWNNRKRMLRFGLWTFVLNLTRVAYGPGPNRLVAVNYLPTDVVATFGFAGQLANMGRRFMPSRLISTMIRPLLLARFTSTGDFQRLVHMINLVYRINVTTLVPPIGMLVVGGAPVFDLLTGDKYGAAAPLLAGLLVVLVSEGMRGLVELIVQAVEKNHIFAGTNLVQSLSLLTAIPMIGWIGPWGLIVANLVGTFLSNLVLVIWLRRYGYVFRITWGPILLIFFFAVVAWAVSEGVVRGLGPSLFGVTQGPALVGLVIFPLVFGGLYLWRPPFNAEEQALVLSMLRKPRGKRNGSGDSKHDHAPGDPA